MRPRSPENVLYENGLSGESRGGRARWRPAVHSREELVQALVEGRVAGPVTSHDRRNVRSKIRRLVDGDPDVQFGIRGLEGHSFEEILALVAAEAGFDPDPALAEGPVEVDPVRVLAACEAAGARLVVAAGRGERVLLATGYPAGLPLLYMAAGDLLAASGAELLRPLDGFSWEGDGHREIRYLHDVAVLTTRAQPIHTHSPEAMERMLDEVSPDLVFADHGFAGAAIQAGVETISIVDVNDPAPVVAKGQGRTELVIAMDDNVQPQSYWPCFQALAGPFGGMVAGTPESSASASTGWRGGE